MELDADGTRVIRGDLLTVRFLDYLEANAEDFWQVPHSSRMGCPPEDAIGRDCSTPPEGVTFTALTMNKKAAFWTECPGRAIRLGS